MKRLAGTSLRLVGATLALASVWGCAFLAYRGVALPACPGRGGPAWRELTSAHFVLTTDLAQGDAVAVIEHLERVRAAILKVAWQVTDGPPGRVEVISLLSKREFEDYFPNTILGFTTEDPFSNPIITSGELTRESRTVLTHELAHRLAAYYIRRLPRALNEGLASYLETVHVDDGHTVVMGQPSTRLADASAYRRPGRELFDWGSGRIQVVNARQVAALYATSWLWVHDMVSRHNEQFAELLRRLGNAEEFEKAWSEVFPKLPPEALDGELADYLSGQQYLIIRTELPAVDVGSKERILEDSEVHAVRARLHGFAANFWRRPWHQNAEEADIVETLRLDPKNGFALALNALLARKDRRETFAREATEIAPGDWRSWYALAEVLPDEADTEADVRTALSKAVRLAPNNEHTLNRLAWHYVKRGQYEEALPMAGRAVKLAPWSPEIRDTYAMAAFGLKRCDEALREQRAAVALGEDRGPSAGKDTLMKHLQEIETGCAIAPASP